MNNSGSVIVSWSFDDNTPDTGVLIVGRRDKGEPVKIINAFLGAEAIKIKDLLLEKGMKS